MLLCDEVERLVIGEAMYRNKGNILRKMRISNSEGDFENITSKKEIKHLLESAVVRKTNRIAPILCYILAISERRGNHMV